MGRTIGIKLRFEDFHTVTRDLASHTADAGNIRRAAGEFLRRITLQQKLRLLGVRVSALSSIRSAHTTNNSIQKELPLKL